MSKRAAKKKAPVKKAAKNKARKTAPKKEETTTVQETAPSESSTPASSAGPVPQATVLSRHDGTMHLRGAKGFSLGELSAAGLTFTLANGLGVPLDIRRRSSLDTNIDALKGWYKPVPKKAKAPKSETKPKPAKRAKKAGKKSKKE